MVEVTTEVESAGQLVTVAAQLITVISLVMYTVEVVIWGPPVTVEVPVTVEAPVTVELPDKEDPVAEAEVRLEAAAVPLGMPEDWDAETETPAEALDEAEDEPLL